MRGGVHHGQVTGLLQSFHLDYAKCECFISSLREKKDCLNVGTLCLTHVVVVVVVVVVIIRTKSVTLATSWRPVAAQSCMSLIWQTWMLWSKQKQE